MTPKDQIIIALDQSNLESIEKLVDELSPFVSCFKIGLEAMTAFGAPRLVELIGRKGGKVFLDGKFHDIPNTIEKAAKAAANLKVFLFNMHASAGLEAMKKANASKGHSKLIAVTALTSMNDENASLIYKRNSADTVVEFSLWAREAGLDGVVCSAQELSLIRNHPNLGEDFLTVTPGIRPTWAQKNDQVRVMTPKEAIQNGASMLVIGRPITDPPAEIGSPKFAVEKILEEIS